MHKYASTLKMGKKIYQITVLRNEVSSNAATPNYLVLESNSFGQDRIKGKKSIIMLQASEDYSDFKLGRSNDTHIRVQDISISRDHAFIKYSDDGFYIHDNKSKFGTLVLAPQKLYLQIGEKATV